MSQSQSSSFSLSHLEQLDVLTTPDTNAYLLALKNNTIPIEELKNLPRIIDIFMRFHRGKKIGQQSLALKFFERSLEWHMQAFPAVESSKFALFDHCLDEVVSAVGPAFEQLFGIIRQEMEYGKALLKALRMRIASSGEILKRISHLAISSVNAGLPYILQYCGDDSTIRKLQRFGISMYQVARYTSGINDTSSFNGDLYKEWEDVFRKYIELNTTSIDFLRKLPPASVFPPDCASSYLECVGTVLNQFIYSASEVRDLRLLKEAYSAVITILSKHLSRPDAKTVHKSINYPLLFHSLCQSLSTYTNLLEADPSNQTVQTALTLFAKCLASICRACGPIIMNLKIETEDNIPICFARVYSCVLFLVSRFECNPIRPLVALVNDSPCLINIKSTLLKVIGDIILSQSISTDAQKMIFSHLLSLSGSYPSLQLFDPVSDNVEIHPQLQLEPLKMDISSESLSSVEFLAAHLWVLRILLQGWDGLPQSVANAYFSSPPSPQSNIISFFITSLESAPLTVFNYDDITPSDIKRNAHLKSPYHSSLEAFIIFTKILPIEYLPIWEETMMSCLLMTQTEVVSDLLIDLWAITAKSVCPGVAKDWVDCILRINASLELSDALLRYKLSNLAFRLLEVLPVNDQIVYISSLRPSEATLENQSRILSLFSQFPLTIYTAMSLDETLITTIISVLRVAESHTSQLKELYENVTSMDAKCDICVAMIPATQSAARIVECFLAQPESQQSEISEPLSSIFQSMICMVKFIFEAVENKAETGQTRNLAKILKSADVAMEFLTTTIAWIIQCKIEIPITEALSVLEKWAAAPIPLGLCGLRSVGALFGRLAKMKAHDQAALKLLKPIFMTLKFHLFSTSGTLQCYLLDCFNSMISAHDALKMLIQDQQEMAGLISDVDRISVELSKGVKRERIEKSLVPSILQSLPTLYMDSQVGSLKSLEVFTTSPIIQLSALSSAANSANTCDVSDLASKAQIKTQNSTDVSLDHYLHCMNIVKDLNEVFNGNVTTKLGSGQGVLGLGLSKDEVKLLREKMDELKGMLRESG